MNLLIHKGKKAEDIIIKDGTIPDPISMDNDEFKVVQTTIKHRLEGGETDKWENIPRGISEFLRRPQYELTICKPWRIQALSTKS